MKGNLTSCLSKRCVTADGFSRGFLSINFQLPGPEIQVCKNDIIVVDVFNEADSMMVCHILLNVRFISTRSFVTSLELMMSAPISITLMQAIKKQTDCTVS